MKFLFFQYPPAKEEPAPPPDPAPPPREENKSDKEPRSFKVGDDVEYNSVTFGEWLLTTIVALHPDGLTCDLAGHSFTRPGAEISRLRLPTTSRSSGQKRPPDPAPPGPETLESPLKQRRVDPGPPSPLADLLKAEYGPFTILRALKALPLNDSQPEYVRALANKGTGRRLPAAIARDLTRHEIAALHIYTLGELDAFPGAPRVHAELNAALDAWRTSPDTLKRYFPLLQLLVSAFTKYGGEEHGNLFRVERYDFSSSEQYQQGRTITWWSFKSTTTAPTVVSDFRGTEANTIFHISTKNGLSMGKFSEFPDEKEVLLFPGTRMRVTSIKTSAVNRALHGPDVNVCEVFLQEIDPFPNRWGNESGP